MFSVAVASVAQLTSITVRETSSRQRLNHSSIQAVLGHDHLVVEGRKEFIGRNNPGPPELPMGRWELLHETIV